MRKSFSLLRPFGLVLWMVVITGCGSKEHAGAPESIGERKNPQGEVIQQIVRQVSTKSKDVLLTPEGPKKSIKYRVKYFSQAGKNPRRELTFVSDQEFRFAGDGENDLQYFERFWPVGDSTLWVGAGLNPNKQQDLHVVVFDETRLILKKTFEVIGKWEAGKATFEFENGNRILSFDSSDGRKRFDVVAGGLIE